MNNTSAESYLKDGCGRCDLFKTPACKVHRWADALVALRALLQASGLVEEMKWGSPTYTLDGKNVIMLVARKEFCALTFFKGSALDDDKGLLVPIGPNTRVARLLKFRSAAEVLERSEITGALVQQAIDFQRSGVQIERTHTREPVPIELEQRLAADAELREAFQALTPGRQRSHILHVSGAKQSATRERRVEKCAPRILAGKGFNER